MQVSRFISHSIATISFLFFTTSSWAALELELTQGVDSAIPIAIVPFANQTSNVPGNTTLTDVIKNDMQNSGEFRVKMPSALSNQPENVPGIDLSYWQKQGVNAILVGQVKQIGAAQYQVSYQLVDLYAKANRSSKTVSPDAILLNQTFNVQQNGLRQLAHHISDLVYQKLTGVQGVFSTKIAYVLVKHSDNQPPQYLLNIADADGFAPQTLLTSTQPIMSPTWSPNGSDIAYVSFEGHQASIYLQELATGQRELVSRFPGINGAPAFSPDGRKLAMVLTRTGNPKIFVLDLSSHQLTQITHGYAIDTEPVWSPKSDVLYFTSNRAGGPQIYQYDFASAQTSRVTFDGDYNARACLTPHGKSLVMMHKEVDLFGIAKQDLSSGRVTMLTASGADDSPSLAPNGKMVLYGTEFAGHEVLGVVSLDGRVKLRLPSQEGDVQDPAWSPFLS